ncbi:tRNA lysidine(34) synthetase TilS, partial [Micromonospora sp. NPDC003776]
PGGPEAAAREARYEALLAAARRHHAAAVLLGHTRDDQAETVLLALARGAGPRGLAGMPERREWAGMPLLRPLLDVTREDTRKACAALGLVPWDDPHNADPAYARSRVRADLLPALVDALGPGVVDNLARTARLLAADTAALDALAAAALAEVRRPEGGLSVDGLATLPAAVRTRVLHAWARELGAPPAALSHRHVAALDALVTDWHGQGPVHLPGGLPVLRRAGRLVLAAHR